MTSEVHPSVALQRIECTCLCSFFAREIGELDLRGNKFMDKLKLAVDKPQASCLALRLVGVVRPITAKDNVTCVFVKICSELEWSAYKSR